MSTKSTSREDLINEESRWAFIGNWRVEEQSNDRMQPSGAVISHDGRQVTRSMARRQHQIAYKRWSQERSE